MVVYYPSKPQSQYSLRSSAGSKKNTKFSTFTLPPEVSTFRESLTSKTYFNDLNCLPNHSHVGFKEVFGGKNIFCTGSSYEGFYSALGFTGVGEYVFTNGTIYKGEFFDGLFHGNGVFKFSNNKIISARFAHGEIIENSATITSLQGPIFNLAKYCKMPDRRYFVEIKNGLNPVTEEHLTSNPNPPKLPPDGYDTGTGIYYEKKDIVEEDPYLVGNRIRIPTEQEIKYIKETYRHGHDDAVGPNKSLYEKWDTGRKRDKSESTSVDSVDFDVLSYWSEDLSENINKKKHSHQNFDDILSGVNKAIKSYNALCAYEDSDDLSTIVPTISEESSRSSIWDRLFKEQVSAEGEDQEVTDHFEEYLVNKYLIPFTKEVGVSEEYATDDSQKSFEEVQSSFSNVSGLTDLFDNDVDYSLEDLSEDIMDTENDGNASENETGDEIDDIPTDTVKGEVEN